MIPSMAVVYDHPKDYPNSYVARLWRNGLPTDNVIIGGDLYLLRALIRERFDLHCSLDRCAGDDPAILEVWV